MLKYSNENIIKKNIVEKRFYYKLQILYTRNKIAYYEYNYLKVKVTFALNNLKIFIYQIYMISFKVHFEYNNDKTI